MNINRLRASAAACIVSFSCAKTSQAGEFVPLKLHPFATFDTFLPADAGDGIWGEAQTGMRQLSGSGYAVTGNIKTKAAIGGRVGVSAQVTEAFDIGLSAGYISGPNSDVSVSVAGGGNDGTLSDKRDLSYLRFLVEPAVNFKLGERSALHLGAGLGFAQGRTEETIACAGSACVVNGTIANNSTTWTGFTWEISPYVSWSNAIFGARYAGFPKFSGNSTNAKVEWTSLGLFAGVKF